MNNKTIRVDYLARVEGEGALEVKIKGDRVTDVKLRIFEPPRFFEAFLRGRLYSEAPDITARICGICPIAYQMSSVHAMEDALGVKVDGQLRALRRLIYCGEWIESHILHVAMLHAPDFLGYEDAIEMARDHPEVVRLALRLKKAGNAIVALVGGREIHPVNVRVGGFHRAPTRREFAPLLDELLEARDETLGLIDWVSKLDFPDFERDYEFVALRHPQEYPFNEGRLVSSNGLDIAISDFDHHFTEEHVEHSNALHCALRERGAYFVGPLARYNLNFDLLSPLAQETAQRAGLSSECRNPFKSIIVRSVEALYAFDEAIRIIEEYEMPDLAAVEIHPRAFTGHGCTEAPRGILYHRYLLDGQGVILDAKIVPPTSQNQKTIEDDLRQFASDRIHLEQDALAWQCEQAVRNYDPCISCATHFLRLQVERE
jgi:coenzyme F420-reducing hydrogenase alpha subunit